MIVVNNQTANAGVLSGVGLRRQKISLNVCSSFSFSLSVVLCMHAKSLQSGLTLCDSMDCSLPGSSVLGLLQARILEWVAMPFSR